MLTVISFDVGDTLVTYHYLEYVWNKVIPRLYADNTGVGYEEAEAFVLREYDRIGPDNIGWYLPEYWFDHFHLDQDPMEVFNSHVDKIKFFPEVPLVLKSLKSKYDLIIASGIPTNLVERMMRDFRTCFKRIFSPVTDLQQVSKTAEFYKHVCNAMGVKPSAKIHVGDDVIHDFEIPRTVGIQSFLLDRTGEKTGEYVIRNLVELGDKILRNRSIDVEVVFEAGRITEKGSEYQRLKEAGVAVRNDTNSQLMHNKVMIVDSLIVLTGSARGK